MTAIEVARHGGAEVLTLVDLPIPQPKPNEIVVKIAAAGVNFIDVYYRDGRYPMATPFVPGSEAAGTVHTVGSEVKSLKPGHPAAYATVSRADADNAPIPTERAVRLPRGVSHHQAA